MTYFDVSKMIWPILDNLGDGNLEYLGCCFFVGNPPKLVTCRHILEGAIRATAQSPSDKNFLIENIKFHHKLDLAIADVRSSEMQIFEPLSCPLTMGGELVANAYLKTMIKDEKSILPHFSKGYITSTPLGSFLNQGRGVYNLSFPSLAGYSGAPVFVFNTTYFAGMLIGNHESSVTVFSHSEVDDDGKKWEEKTVRVIDEGIFIGYNDIMDFITQNI